MIQGQAITQEQTEDQATAPEQAMDTDRAMKNPAMI